MTPLAAAQFLETQEPIVIKRGLVTLLEWQAAKGKAIVHFGWYLRKLKEPKPKMSEADRQRWRELVQGIGSRP